MLIIQGGWITEIENDKPDTLSSGYIKLWVHQVLGTSISELHKKTTKDLHEDESFSCQQFKAVGSLKFTLEILIKALD